MRFDDAVASLFSVSVDQFVAERKRLAGELKAAGDKAGAARLAKLARPPISAWVVDQLWWQARPAFDALFETAERLRDGKLDAMAAHREAIAKLRAEATRILSGSGHGATEATLRRVTQTLSALAAAGGWDPDLPGALSADRDPPGFEAIGISAASLSPAPDDSDDSDDSDDDDRQRQAAEARQREEREAAAARAEAAAAQRRIAAERARVAAERQRLEAALRTAHGDVAERQREVARLTRELEAARDGVAQAEAVVAGLEERIARLGQLAQPDALGN